MNNECTGCFAPASFVGGRASCSTFTFTFTLQEIRIGIGAFVGTKNINI